MPSRPPRPCSGAYGCRDPIVAQGKCRRHLASKRRRSDQIRGSSTERGYDGDHRELFRDQVLMRDKYVCVIDGCRARATDADHYPRSRRELLAAGLDPNDPQYGRALCHSCHSRHTGRTEGKDNFRRL